MLGDLFEGSLRVDPTAATPDELARPPHPVPTCKGVVAFADADDRCISMLTAANIRRTAAHRLFAETTDQPHRRPEIAPLVRAIYYQCCHNDFATALKYLHAARALWPDSWQSMVSLPKTWFVRIDLSAEWPNFSLAEKPVFSASRRAFGPFPTRKAASRYITALQTAFALCKRPDLVDSPQKAAACPYLQMGTCPAPCVGRISRQEYRGRIENAVEAAAGRPGAIADDLRRRMLHLAADRQFEQADLIKKRLQALDVLREKDYLWTHDLAEFAILHIDRWARSPSPDGKKRKLPACAGYLILPGRIHLLDPFTPANAPQLVDALGSILDRESQATVPDLTTQNLALLSYFCYRNNPPGLWLDCSTDSGGYKLPKAAIIAARSEDLWKRKSEA